METISEDALRGLEAERLRRQLDWVWERSPLYRKKFADAGIDIAGIDRDRLSELPFTTKSEVRDSQDEYGPLGGHACVPFNEVVRVHASSGTTGRPTLVGATQNDIAMWNELVGRTLWAQGVRPGTRSWVALMMSWWIAGLSFYEALEHIGATVLPGGNTEPARAFAVFAQTGLDYVISTPSFVTYLASSAQDELDLDVAELGVSHMGLGGEPGAGIPEVRRRLEATWGCKVYDGMGTADFATNIWTECEHQAGMHFLGQGLIIPEIVDPESEVAMPIVTGNIGELVYTAIQRECVPLIRFRVGDLVRIEATEPCACGRSGYRIRCVGRTDDMLIVQGVNVYPSAVLDVVSAFAPETTGELEIHVPATGTRVEPPVHVRVEHGDSPRELDRLASALEQVLRRELMFRARVEIVPPGTLAPAGKMKRRLVVREG